MENNYTVYHLHSMFSNCWINIDSVTKFTKYIERAKECGMTAIAFSEHGNVFGWKQKKDAVEKAGLKYIHATEAYVTERLLYDSPDGKEPYSVRDNYHCVLIARNYEGVKEINRLLSRAARRYDGTGHFYYTPRISFDELKGTSDNIIICTACIASILSKGSPELKQQFIDFMVQNKDRCFLEVQHHNTETQKEYNKYLLDLSKSTGLKLIAGTDTHCLDELDAEARVVLQRGKKTFFEGEEGWDLTWKTYDELRAAYATQGVLSDSDALRAIENTNFMSGLVEEFTLKNDLKYPKVSENPYETLKNEVFGDPSGVKNIIDEGFSEQVVMDRLKQEYDTAVAVDSCDYFLLQKHVTDWCHAHDIWSGPGRGSAASSLILYKFGVTEINPLKHGFQFWRFMDKSKYSLADWIFNSRSA